MNTLIFWRKPTKRKLLEAGVYPVNSLSELVVLIGDYVAGIVRIEVKRHGVVDVAPIGMVLLGLGVKGHFCHKGESFFEIFKFKAGDQLVIFFFPHGSSFFRFACTTPAGTIRSRA